jgi:hypothetical protein
MQYYNTNGIRGVDIKMEQGERYSNKGLMDRTEYDGTGNPAEAAARQVGGLHYKNKKCEVWSIIDEYGLDYYRGNALKYILRNKMDVYEDIQKAEHYLQKWLEVNKGINKG